MTKVITRYFESAEKARAARHELVQRQRFSPRIVQYFATADGLAADLKSAHVDADTADAYQSRVAKGGAVLLVRADYKPLNVARTAREVTAAYGAADMGGMIEEVVVKVDHDPLASSLLLDHPLLLSKPRDPQSTTFHMANWPIPLISRRKPMTESVIEPHARMANWPIGLLAPSEVRYGRFPFGLLVPGHKFMAKFPFGHIVPGHKFMAKFPFGHIVPGHKFMAKFPFGHIVPGHKFMAKFPFGHLVPDHRRMANWPFPLLINGKTGTNALMPGGPRMANFPIPLISRRKPSNRSIFSRHARMANFPLPLISQRKPYTGSVFPRHARMADMILPLVIRKSETTTPDADKRYSLSRMLGMPTVIQR
jgi:hypothetical protein